ncbi:probable G-protein coupled receptor 156 [Ictalurus furcatus]|uniref:probable G-protein coupled receptor 156 n=1 Tax=Ictalurus furcatus TaxID=66913 RepID=UPI00235043BB|nr:probable G-protein coupled receptor 156 [Ictalurus furcatus]
MEIRPNCSTHCDSASCFIHPAVNKQQSWDILLRLCTLSTRVVEVQSRSLSPVLCAVVWTLLSCGILLSFLFLLFTVRYKNNRIVKMSSPNLNMLTLLGSVLTYTSGFLFAIEDRSPVQGAGPKAVMQAWVWTLCIGSSLVFGPILGKTWRLYRVFTQRLPDRRVIIRDIRLMGFVALLVLVDLLILAAWSLTDPVKCFRSVSALVKVVEFDVRYSLSQTDSCSSHYSELWVLLLCALKAGLLVYGMYLAGLTSSVSLPPVNQSLTIMTAVYLVTASTALAVPVSLYLRSWPNLVYSMLSGTIFICTTAINCLIFVPQLTQWRQFEEDVNPQPSHMAKYFSSKSLRSSENDIYYLLGEYDSMKRLISEKDAVINSLQEQVKNAKDKLLKLMSVGHLQDEREMDSSTTNLNSSSTQTTVVPPEPPASPLPMREVTPPAALSTPPYVPPPSIPSSPPSLSSYETPPSSQNTESSPYFSPHSPDRAPQNSQVSHLKLENAGLTKESQPKRNFKSTSVSVEPSEVMNMPLDSPVNLITLHESTSPAWSGPPPDAAGSVVESIVPSVVGRQGFVSSEQLEEILHDLSVDAISSSLRSPDGVRRPSYPANPAGVRRPSNPASPAGVRRPSKTIFSSRSTLQLYFPSISPYMMRKRRPPFHACRKGPPPYYYPGSAPPGCRRTRELKPASSTSLTHKELHNTEKEGNEGEKEDESSRTWFDSNTQSRSGRRRSRRTPRDCSSIEQPSGSLAGLERTGATDSYGYSDSESSSSEDYCYYHRPYCEACMHSPYASSDSSSSETSDSEYTELDHSSHPVVNFKEDLKPTFV